MKTLYSVNGLELTSELTKYANSKTAHLAKQVPRRLRGAATCKVVFSQAGEDSDKMSTCNIILTLGQTTLEADETTQHMYAALDIAIVHIEQQVAAYARSHRHRLLRRHKTVE